MRRAVARVMVAAVIAAMGTWGLAEGGAGASPAASAPSRHEEVGALVDDASLIAELEAMQRKLADVRDLSTHFEQEKHTSLLRKPLKSSGKIRMVGNLMRWDTQRPAESTMLIAEDGIRLYYPEQKLIEVYRLDQQMARMAASPVPRIGVMKEHFVFGRAAAGELLTGADEGKFLGVRLTPRQQSLRQHLKEVRLVIDRQSAYLKQMEMVDADGDRTVVKFDDLKVNTGLKAEELQLKAPAGTKISYPLSAEGADAGADAATEKR